MERLLTKLRNWPPWWKTPPLKVRLLLGVTGMMVGFAALLTVLR